VQDGIRIRIRHIRQELFMSLFMVEGRALIGYFELKNIYYALRVARSLDG
jgi:hypothetical protein